MGTLKSADMHVGQLSPNVIPIDVFVDRPEFELTETAVEPLTSGATGSPSAPQPDRAAIKPKVETIAAKRVI